MRKDACTRFFEKFLREVSNGRADRAHCNPALQFVKNAKAGRYDRLSDEEYEDHLRRVEALSAFWRDKESQTAADVLRSALEQIDIDRISLRQIAEILADCYCSSVDLRREPDITEESNDTEESGSDAAQQKQRRLPASKMDLDEAGPKDEKPSSPQEIYGYLAKQIYGQEEAVKAAAMLLYNHQQGRKRNLLFIGQTGSGKTEIWRVCQQLEPRVRVIDSTIITGEGWSGSFKIKNIFDGMSQQDAERAVIVFDEFDKLCEPQITSGGSNKSLIVQNELLKLIEGTTVYLKDFAVDTSKISFVFCGSFEQLTEMKTDSEAERSIGFGADLGRRDANRVYEHTLEPADLVKYAGMRQEIAGRIHQIVQLLPMTAETYQEILHHDQISPLRQLERQYGVKLCLDRDTEQKLVREAERTRMGVRYLRSRIQQMLDDQMFQDCGQTEYRLSA